MTSWSIHRKKQLADTANPEDHKNNEKEYFFLNLHKTISFAHCSLMKGTVVVTALLKTNQMHNF